MAILTVGVDLAKNVFALHGVNETGAVQSLSTRRHLDKLNAPVIVAYASLETSHFQSQSRDFVAALQTAGKSVQLLVAEDYNHFEIIETLANPYGVLGRAMLALMNLVPNEGQ